MAIARIKSFIDSGLKSSSLNRTTNLEPEVGIKIVHSPAAKALYVTVIGARHLPQNFGFTRVNSYVVKVKLLPGKEKFETTPKNESWPSWNEEFTFPLTKETKSKFGKTKVTEEEISGSKFVVATVYAVLEDKPLIATEKKESENDKAKGESSKKGKKDTSAFKSMASTSDSSKANVLTQFFGKQSDKEKTSVPQRSARDRIFDKRRTLGAATVKLDPGVFVTKPAKPKHASDVSTGETWWPLKPISSGISGADERRESKKGQVEISLCQEKGDKDGESGGNLVLSLSKLRCSLHTMHEHEALKGQLYIKMSVVDNGIVTHFWKSDRFTPTISTSFSPDNARVIAKNPQGDVSFVVKFVSKNKMGKKTAIGHFVIGPDGGGTYGEQWKQALAKPGQQITKWQPFE
ncbi:uncharacterized protein LOC107218266 [Neodiprion lecontei]|uniref:Uncharacterized protein LOC107218266 n=1 Tax=Neodiprion lecontei TaxID=441921 RepID=A0A6J0B9C8_NEOLC|nr:uncharacterized protein LOC107218266 [Neodiprion lecontei]XP_046591298.1 uncharacterized protein LOC107218266 [Neodiprion lecontei]